MNETPPPERELVALLELSERATTVPQGVSALDAVDVAAAEALGATGSPASEPERMAFEAWMRGHCWSLCATWNGTEYRGDAEQGGHYCPKAATTRMLWAAWRDRAALSRMTPPPAELGKGE